MFQQRRTEAGGPRTAGAAGPRSGGRIVVDQLVANGIDAAFCVPGESFLAVLDALHDAPVRLVTCRHEAAAANMAVAYGKLTGRPGVCLVTRGPGATQASVGVHTAAQDSAPMLLLVGQVGRDQRGREAFQELDVPAVFGPMAKWAAEAGDPARLPELLARGVKVALGCDSPNNSNHLDIVRVLNMAAIQYKDARQDMNQMPAETALEMATLTGAQALGLGDELGSIEPGKKADLVMFDTQRPEWQALWNPINNLVYNADGRSVHTVVVDGRVVVDTYRQSFVDESRLFATVQEIGERLQTRTGVSFPRSRWPVV